MAFRTLIILGICCVAPCGTLLAQQDSPPPNDVPTSFEKPRLIVDTQGFSSAVRGLSFSPDDRYLAAAAESTVRIWNLKSGRLEQTLRGNTGPVGIGRVTSVQFHPGGRFLAVSVDNVPVNEPAIQIYDLTRPTEILKTLRGSENGELRLAFSRDGGLLAVWGSDHKLRVWDWSEGVVKSTIALPGTPGKTAEYLGFPSVAPLVMFSQTSEPHVYDALTGLEANILDLAEFWEKFIGRENSIASMIQKNARPDKIETAWDINADLGFYVTTGRERKDGRDEYWAEAYTLGKEKVSYSGHRYFGTAAAMNRGCTVAATADALGEVHVWDVGTGRRVWKLTGNSKPLYAAALDADSGRLAYATLAYPTGEWGFNHCGGLNRVFDLTSRTSDRSVTGPWRREVLELKGYKLSYVREKVDGRDLDRFKLISPEKNAKPISFDNPNAMCATLARLPGDGETAVVVGQTDGLIKIFDAAGLLRAVFSGHGSIVTSLSTSADGKLLISSSMDGTIRLWPLNVPQNAGGLDLITGAESVVSRLVEGGSAQKAGVLVGDRIVSVNNLSTSQIADLLVAGKAPFRPKETVRLEVERKGKRLTISVPLVAGRGEFGIEVVEPLLNLFLTEIDQQQEWVLWTEEGYYDSSASGDRLVGWHRNQGWSKAAQFFPAHHFQRRFYRPDVISQVLKLGSVAEAVKKADFDAGRPPNPVDLRERLAQDAPPTVRIAEPAPQLRTLEKTLVVKFRIDPNGDEAVTGAKVLVNGRPTASFQFDSANPPPADGSLERTVELDPGENEISVIASNRVADSVASTIRVERLAAEGAEDRPRLVALAIGISKYTLGENVSLKFAHKDAVDFAAALEKQKGRMFSSVELHVLTNEEATTEKIRDELGWFEQELTKDDVGVLFVSAHGYVDEQQRYYLVPHDFDPKRLRNKSIPYSEFVSLLESARSRLLVMFADTCHSGGITGGKLSIDPYRELQDDKLGAVVFSSSAPTQQSIENDEWGHGAFTQALLDVFSDKASDSTGDGFLSLIELKLHLSRRVQKLTASEQTPVTRFPSTFDDYALIQYEGVPTASLLAGTRIAVGDRAKALAAKAPAGNEDVEKLMAEAKTLTRRYKFDEAIEVLERVIRIDPKHAVAYSRRGMIAVARRDLLKAFADLQHAFELEPQSTAVLTNRGWGFYLLDDLDKALADADEAIRLDGKDAAARQLRATVLAAQKKLDDALAEAGRAVEADPKDHNGYLSRGLILKALKRDKESRAEFERAVELAPENSTVRSSFGRFLYDAGEVEAAKAQFDRAIELNPNDFDALSDRAAMFNMQGKVREAIQDVTASIERGNRSRQIYLNRGFSRVQLGEIAAALSDFNEAILLEPSHYLAYAARGKQYLTLGKFDWALEDFRRAYGLESSDGILAGNYSRSLLVGAGQIDEAVEVGRKAVELTPGDYNAVISLVLALECAGKTREAVEAIRAGVEAAPENASLLQDGAGFLARHFDPKFRDGKTALTYATKACELTKFADEDCLVALADAQAALGQFPQALATLAKVKNQESEKVTYRLGLFKAKQIVTYDQLTTVAESLLVRSRIEASLRVIERILTRDPGSVVGYLLRGKALVEQKRYSAAIADLEKALKIAPTNTQTMIVLGQLLSAAPDAKDRNAKRAIEVLTRACDLTGRKAYPPLYFLSTAYAEAGRFPEALETLAKARQAAPPSVRGYFDEVEESYKNKQPIRMAR